MGLETATYIDDLNVDNPAANDPKSQGDDHIRLIKSVLKNTFPGANTAFNLQQGGVIFASTDRTLTDDDRGKAIFATKTGDDNTQTLTLPAGAEPGWLVSIRHVRAGDNALLVIAESSDADISSVGVTLNDDDRIEMNTPLEQVSIVRGTNVWYVYAGDLGVIPLSRIPVLTNEKIPQLEDEKLPDEIPVDNLPFNIVETSMTAWEALTQYADNTLYVFTSE